MHKGSPVEIQTPAHWNLIDHSVTAPPPVIAQQYSSATLVSLRLHCGRKNSAHLSKCCDFNFCLFLKLRESEIEFALSLRVGGGECL
jgi:hypothetical protein